MIYPTRRAVVTSLLSASGLAASGGSARAESTFDILVGALYPLSGPDAIVGENAGYALRTALEIVDGDYDLDLPLARADHLPSIPGGRLKLMMADHKGNPNVAAAEAEKLIASGKIVALLGCGDEKAAEAVSAVCDKAGIAFLDTDSVTRQGQRASNFRFSLAADEANRVKTVFDFFEHLKETKKIEVKSIALLLDKEREDIRTAQFLRAAAAGMGISIAGEAPHTRGQPKLAKDGAEKLRARADALILIGPSHDGVELSALLSGGAKAAQIICFPAKLSDRAVGPTAEAAEGMIFTKGFSRDARDNDPNIAGINTLYRSIAHKDLDELAALQFTGFLTMAVAINDAKAPTPRAVIEKLSALSIAGNHTIMPWDRLSFNSQGKNPAAAVVMAQRQGDKLVTIYPSQFATGVPRWKA